MRFLKKISLILASISAISILTACSSTPPANPNNLCSVFQEKDSWYVAAHKVHNKYNVPINVAMAIMYQESRFVDDAKPPMRYFLYVIPYGRGSSSYGYAQAQDEVWDDYVDEAGSFFSSRDDFADALDFIAWYMTKTKKINGIGFNDVYNQYLNYHEGWGGFAKKSYAKKDWLINTARQVEQRSQRYREQLLQCNLY